MTIIDLAGIAKNSSGIITADRYVGGFVKCLGGGENALCPAKVFEMERPQFDLMVKESASRLTYRDEDTTLKIADSELMTKAAKMRDENEVIVKKALAVFESVMSKTVQDRDGDLLHTKGMEVDENMPLLWMHLQVQPIGPFLGKSLHDDVWLKGMFAIAATKMGEDAVTLAELGALRTSIGFNPVEGQVKPRKTRTVMGKKQVINYEIKACKVLEDSMVSVPSLEEATITAFSAKKLRDPLVNQWAKSMFDARPAQSPGMELMTKAKDGPGNTNDGDPKNTGDPNDTVNEEEDAPKAKKPKKGKTSNITEEVVSKNGKNGNDDNSEQDVKNFNPDACDCDGVCVKCIAEAELTIKAKKDDSKKGEAGKNTGAAVRRQIQRLMDAGMTLEEIGKRVNRDSSTLGGIRSGEIKNPPKALLVALEKITPPKKASKAFALMQKGFTPSSLDGLSGSMVDMLLTERVSVAPERKSSEPLIVKSFADLISHKMHGMNDHFLPGSYEWVTEKLWRMSKTFLMGQGLMTDDDFHSSVVATFADEAILCFGHWDNNQCFRASWESDADGMPVFVGDAEPVEIKAEVVAKRLEVMSKHFGDMATGKEPDAITLMRQLGAKMIDSDDDTLPQAVQMMSHAVDVFNDQVGYDEPIFQ